MKAGHNTKIVIGAFGALCLSIGAYLYWASRVTERPSSPTVEAMPTVNPATRPNLIAIDSAAVESRRRSRPAIHPFSDVPQSRVGLPLENDPFVAETLEEQRWLDRNGFPNSLQWTIYSTASDMLLEQAAQAGDSVAAVMLYGRALAKGDAAASGKLMAESAKGSNFALSTLAAYLAGSRNGNPRLGYAISRVGEMRGDWRAAMLRDGMFPRPLSSQERILAEADALQIFKDLQQHSKKRPFVDPRPIRN